MRGSFAAIACIALAVFVVLVSSIATATPESSASVQAVTDPLPPRIGIIGAGIGGATTAYYLRKELASRNAYIDVFERSRVGGRAEEITVDGQVIEVGGSIIHGQNKHLRDLADELGLKRVKPGSGKADSPLSIHDGHSFVFQESAWSLVTLYRMVSRYGLSFLWLRQAASKMLNRFVWIYALQMNGTAFECPEDMLRAIGLFNLTTHTMTRETQGILGDSQKAERFRRELVGGINHVNYNQDNNLNAFAGMVSMLPTTDDRLFKIREGNSQLAARALSACGAALHTVAALKIEKLEDYYRLITERGLILGQYDAIVIATPLKFSNLTIQSGMIPDLPDIAYQETITTVVRGKMRASFFNTSTLPQGEYVVASENADLPFSVVSPLSDYKEGLRLYKLFSTELLGHSLLSSLFQNLTVIHSRPWLAYPKFAPPEKFVPFQLNEGLFYNNALENAASAMEIAAIAGKNSALLVKRHLDTRLGHQQESTKKAEL